MSAKETRIALTDFHYRLSAFTTTEEKARLLL
jgi:hypothetical protein